MGRPSIQHESFSSEVVCFEKRKYQDILPNRIRLSLFLFSHRNARHDELIITVMMERGRVRF